MRLSLMLGVTGLMIVGPAAAQVPPPSALDRAYSILAEGSLDAAHAAFLDVAGGLPPSEATEVLRIMGVLGRVSDEAGALVAQVVTAARAGRMDRVEALIADRSGSFSEADDAAVVSLAARWSEDQGDAVQASRFYEIVASGPRGVAEWPEAVVGWARTYAGPDDSEAGVAGALEDLIVAHPNGALTPAARRQLERFRSQGERRK